MEQTTFPTYKSPPMKPFFYTHLTTSTPDSHQISKRIKGLLAYSERFKGNRVDYPNINPRFSPLRTRDYRKARELTLEIWDPMIQASFLEKFLKSQRNLHTIRTKVLTQSRIQVLPEKKDKGEILGRLCEILSKNSRLNRVHIDFNEKETHRVKPEFTKGIKPMRTLPRLKDLDVTVDGKQILPFSISLKKVGFNEENPNMAAIEKLMKKTLKFDQLDTIRIDTQDLELEDYDKFLDALALVISKLPNFRELDFNYSEGLKFSLENAIKILDILSKPQKFEILRLGFPLDGKSQVSLLKHPLLKAKSLRRTSFSFYFVDEDQTTYEDLDQIFDLLGEVPSLYELSLRFSTDFKINDKITGGQIEKISRMTSLRKFKMAFDFPSMNMSEKQAGSILKSVFKMYFLEELDLQLQKGCLEGNAQDIQGLPRLKKASLRFASQNSMKSIVEILGKCHQLIELGFDVSDRLQDYQGLMMKLIESLRKLKKLQVFNLYACTSCKEGSNMIVDTIEDLLKTCNQLRNLQDLMILMSLSLYLMDNDALQRYRDLVPQLKKNKKYRRSSLACL